jgi:hypothetical protein
VTFRGAASYKEEVIYISVIDHVEEAIRRNVEERLRREREELGIGPEIRLRFIGDDLPDVII